MIAYILNKKSYRFSTAQRELTDLFFPGTICQRAESGLGDLALEIRKESRWGHIFSYWLDGQNRGSMKFNGMKLRSSIRVDWLGDGQLSQYYLEYKGCLSRRLELSDREGRVLSTIKPRFRWKWMKHEYDFDWHPAVEEPQAVELAIYCVQAARVMYMNTNM